MASLLDDETRAELLCFLVVGQLYVFAREGVWLRADHLIESTRMWLAANGGECDWLERARLVAASRAIAGKESGDHFPKDDAGLHQFFNLRAGWFLDYRSHVAQRIYLRFAVYIKES
ncbi:conserved hypothetical protein [Paraburkholderia sacchari]|uniref:hypothetical protein n=1 Tax=Paraburkholderia sacchari TaxID=159450 RepID=UPI0039A51EB7